MCYPTIQNTALSEGGNALYTLFAGTMFESQVYTTFFGIPMIAMDYTGTVIPVIFVVYFASKCSKFFNKIVPDLVKFFFVPMLTLLISIPVGFLVIGPVATFGSTIIAEALWQSATQARCWQEHRRTDMADSCYFRTSLGIYSGIHQQHYDQRI